jgi:hypothetical protein
VVENCEVPLVERLWKGPLRSIELEFDSPALLSLSTDV